MGDGHKEVLEELIDRSNQFLNRSLLLANQYLGVDYHAPAIFYNLKGKTAGLAYPLEWKIRINQSMLITHQIPFIEEVIPHELSHLFVYRYYSVKKRGVIKPHGKEWADFMQECFGLPPKVTHNFEIPLREVTLFVYKCACRTHYLSAIRHNKVLGFKSSYCCKYCTGKLNFLGRTEQVKK
ncbi:SprT-like domain-containing protein [Thorsellia kenyensis]|uniref:SprT-like domain-containing protein n=1 Tax=Thorsellia kenyensis TaxID=1549888 RepID=A0ABV6CDP3_9GAMM